MDLDGRGPALVEQRAASIVKGDERRPEPTDRELATVSRAQDLVHHLGRARLVAGQQQRPREVEEREIEGLASVGARRNCGTEPGQQLNRRLELGEVGLRIVVDREVGLFHASDGGSIVPVPVPVPVPVAV